MVDTFGTLVNLSEKNRGLLIKLDGSDVEQWYTAHYNLNLKYASYNKGKRVKLGFWKEDPSIINFLAPESYVPKSQQAGGTNVSVNSQITPSVDKSAFYAERNRDIRSQMLVKAAIQLANTHNFYCVNEGDRSAMFNPSQENLKTLALELNKTIEAVKEKLGEDGHKEPQSTHQF